MMDHTEIERNDVVERYVTGRLDADELARFEEHYFDCAACCDAVEDAERLELGLSQVAAEETARVVRGSLVVQQSVLAALLARARRPLVAGLVLAVALVPAGLVWRGHQRLTSELASAMDDLAAAEGALDEERRPRVNTPVLTFEARRGAGATRQISLRPEPEWIVLAIRLAEPVADRYRVTLSASDQLLWQSSELEPSFEGSLSLSLHSSLLPPGGYELSISELPSGEVRSFPLRVVRLP